MQSLSTRFRFGVAASLAALCVGALAGAPAEAEPAVSIDIGGRWEGSKSEFTRAAAECAETGEGCKTLTLDISRCGEGWCGVEVVGGSTCGATALKIAAKAPLEEGETPGASFEGTLSLAKWSEPYVVRVSYDVFSNGDEDASPRLNIVGDTGGEFRMFRRTFPFHSLMSRLGPAVCTPEKALSMVSDPSRSNH